MSLPDNLQTCEYHNTPSRLFFFHSGETFRCYVVKLVENAAILCIPKSGIAMEIFETAEGQDYPGHIGPFIEASVAAVTASGNAARRQLDVILFDFDAGGFDQITASLPLGVDPSQVVDFGKYRSTAEWPHVPGLLEVLRSFIGAGAGRLEAYYSAAEEAIADDAPDVEPQDQTQVLLNQLLSQSQATQRLVSDMQGQFTQVGSRLDRLERGAPAGRGPELAPNPQLFTSTPNGLTEDKQDRLRELAARGPGRLGDLGARQKTALAPTGFPLGEAGTIGDVEEEDLDGEALDLMPTENSPVLERLLKSQTALMQQLVQAKTQQNDPLSMLTSGASDEADAPKGSAVKGIAARQLLLDSFKKQPKRVTSLIRERLAIARRKSSAADLEARDMWYHFQETVPLGSHKTLTYVAFFSANMFEAMERGDADRLHMLCLMLAVFTEQAAHDGGSLRLAHLLSGLEDPPFAQTELHRVVRSEIAHGALADPRWVTTQLQYLKDVDNIQERSSKYGRAPPAKQTDQPPGPDDPAPKKAANKWKPKKKAQRLDEGQEEA